MIDDSLVLSMSKESLERVWAPKAAGALRMHHASAAVSSTGGWGSPPRRRCSARPGRAHTRARVRGSMRWWRGDAAGNACRGDQLGTVVGSGCCAGTGRQCRSTRSVRPEGIEAMDALLATDRATPVWPGCVPTARWPRSPRSANSAISPAGRGTRRRRATAATGPDPRRCASCDPAEAGESCAERLCGRIAAIMGYADQSAVDTGPCRLTELGMDSLMAVRIRNTTRADFGVEPPVAMLLQGASLQDVTADLIRQLGLAEHDNARARRTGFATEHSSAPRRAREPRLRRKRGQSMSMNSNESEPDSLPPNAIAVVGMAGRFPGANFGVGVLGQPAARRGVDRHAVRGRRCWPPGSAKRRWRIRRTCGAHRWSTASTNSTPNSSASPRKPRG